MKLLKKSIVALSAAGVLTGCGGSPNGVVMAPSSPDCITVVDGEYIDSCVYSLV